MSNLFVLGNGFDKEHELPTGYGCFYEYLKNEYPKADEFDFSYLFDSQVLPNGGEEYDEDQVVAFLVSMISQVESSDGDWSDVENSLGNFDYSGLLEELDWIIGDEPDLFKKARIHEDAINNIIIPTIKIKGLFSEWVDSISIHKCDLIDKFDRLINRSLDLFLTFNYTTVLEEIYGVGEGEILHIHGVQGHDIVFGHGIHDRSFETYPTGTEFGLFEIHSSLKKDTTELIHKHQSFFERLREVQNIYSYGFSFSKVDLPYMEEICENLKNNVTWHLSDYDNEEKRNIFIERLRSCGFKGDFSLFSIK